MDDIMKNLEIRKENLIFLLKYRKDELELEKQHQIFGAIKEIEYIMRMISVTDEETESTVKVMANGSEKTSVLKKIGERVSALKTPIKFRFERNEP